MSSTPQFTTEQLQAARSKAWHQTGEPLLTLEAAREWIDTAGLIAFAPQPSLGPASSFVEATLGAATEAPTMAQAATARSLVARLVSEGNALPLNLLGGPGESPDFVVSAQMFSFIFTMRGDKQWKQPPATSGAVKVSPLSLGVYELLAGRGAMTAAELASELGREVTEAAIVRSLNELWMHLRVIPLLQQGEAATIWELTSRRFTKAIKAGVNAGQPTALSALVSLYLHQALLATEDEIAGFLSPLAPRSRIREVVHGLSAARQLEPVVLEGKTLLHIPGTLPEFPEIAAPAKTEGEEGSAAEAIDAQPAEEGRIKRFTRSAGDRPARGDFKGKPARSFADRGARPSRPAFDRGGERERRPFRRDADSAPAERRSFSKPWDEDRKPRPAASGQEGEAPARRPYVRKDRPADGGFAPKRPYVRRDSGEGETRPPRRSFEGGDRKPGGFGAKRPYVRRDAGDGESRPPRRSFEGGDRKPGGFGTKRPYVRRDASEGDSRPPRRSFEGGERKPGGFGAKRPYVRRDAGDGESRQPRRNYEGGDRNPGGFGAKRPYVRRDGGEGVGEGRPPRRNFSGGDRKPTGGFGAKRPYVRRDSGEGTGEGRPARPAFGAKRSFVSKPGGAPARGGKPAGGGFSKRPGDKVPFGGKPGFGKRPKPAGGARPTRKPRNEE